MSDEQPVFHVSGAMAFFGRLIADYPAFWRRLGNLETKALEDDLQNMPLDKPIYVAGLARSGSTILLETLAKVPGVVSHRYKDFPPVYTPYWWNWFMQTAGSGNAEPQERAHRDGIMVTPDSPEAMEEVLWMGSFAHLHDPQHSNILTAANADPDFDRFYKEHIQKLLLARNGSRYLSKGNYLVTRLEYLNHMLPDARFIIPVRHPFGHIASLMKQHALFIRGQSNNDRAREHLKRVGHLEFGLDRTPINTGDNDLTNSIIELWQHGEEVRGWARYWNQVYLYLAEQLERPALAEAALTIRYEDLCDAPADTISRMLAHCDYDMGEQFIAEQSQGIRAPSYYRSKFTAEEEDIILEETAGARARFGY